MFELLKQIVKCFAAPQQVPTWAPEFGQIYLESIASDCFEDHSKVERGLPRPDWSSIATWADEQKFKNEDLDEIWAGFALQWMESVNQSVDADYNILRSQNFLLFHSFDIDQARLFLSSCERTFYQISEFLGSAAFSDGYGPYIIMQFNDPDDYYNYVDLYFPPKSEAITTGCFITSGYGHIALNCHELYMAERVFAHEIGHALVQHLPLPLWLNESIAIASEARRFGSSLYLDHESVDKHYVHWSSETIQDFWSGKAFYMDHSIASLAYVLAEIILKHMVLDTKTEPGKLVEVIKEAHYQDAGRSAIEKHLKKSPSYYVEQFLDSGDWNPKSLDLSVFGKNIE